MAVSSSIFETALILHHKTICMNIGTLYIILLLINKIAEFIKKTHMISKIML